MESRVRQIIRQIPRNYASSLTYIVASPKIAYICRAFSSSYKRISSSFFFARVVEYILTIGSTNCFVDLADGIVFLFFFFENTITVIWKILRLNFTFDKEKTRKEKIKKNIIAANSECLAEKLFPGNNKHLLIYIRQNRTHTHIPRDKRVCNDFALSLSQVIIVIARTKRKLCLI